MTTKTANINDLLYNFLVDRQSAGEISNLSFWEDKHSHPLRNLFNRFMVEYIYKGQSDSVLSTGGNFSRSQSLTVALAEATERYIFLKYSKTKRNVFSFKNFTFKSKDVYFPNTNGFAIHSSFTKCLEGSLSEMIERHEMLKMWYSKTPPVLELDYANLAYINNFKKEVEINGGTLRLFYISNFKGFHTVLFTLFNKDSNDYCILSSFASDLDLFVAIKRGFFELSRSYLSKPKLNANPNMTLESIPDHTLFYQLKQNLHYFDFILNSKYRQVKVQDLYKQKFSFFRAFRLVRILKSLDCEIVFFPTSEIGLNCITCLKVQSARLLEVSFGEKHAGNIRKKFKQITGLDFTNTQGPHPLA